MWYEILYQVLTIINNIILIIIGIPFILQIIYMLLFWLKKRTYKKSDKLNRVCIVIPARNEEDVIYDTVKELKTKQTYNMDYVDIYVIVDNTTDNTAQRAIEAGAKVIIHNDPNTHQVSYALDYGIKEILKTGIKYDYLIRFDADNHCNNEFISLMNDAYNSGIKIARPYESAINLTQSKYTKACGLYYIFDSRFSSRVREKLHLDAHVNGPGAMFAFEIFEKIGGYDATSICEDTEFYFLRMLEGYKCHFVEDAVVYEDLPSTFKDTYARNRRLGGGNIRLFGKYFFKFIWRSIKELRFSYIENLLTFIFIPICLILCTWLPAYYIYDLIYLGLNGMWDQFNMTLMIIGFCLLVLFMFAGIFQGALLVILDYKKMGAKKRRELISGVILFPFYSVIYIVTISIGIVTKPKWIKVNRNAHINKNIIEEDNNSSENNNNNENK